MESFTTEPHGYVVRGTKTVRARSLEFVETLQIQNAISEGKAKNLSEFVKQAIRLELER